MLRMNMINRKLQNCRNSLSYSFACIIEIMRGLYLAPHFGGLGGNLWVCQAHTKSRNKVRPFSKKNEMRLIT